jgi:hypothetical protein
MKRAIGDDRGEVRTATMTRVFVFLAIIGVFGFDAFTAISNRVHTENDAQAAAYAASQAYHNNRNDITAAYAAAVASVAGKDDTVLTSNFTADPDGTIHLLVEHSVHTLVLSHIGPLRHYTVATEHGDANSLNG